jgi:hypothetical protein
MEWLKAIGALMTALAGLILAVDGVFARMDKRRSRKRRASRGGSLLLLCCSLALSWPELLRLINIR